MTDTTTTLKAIPDSVVDRIFEREELSTIVPKLFEIFTEAPMLRKAGEMELGGSKKLMFLKVDDILEQLRDIVKAARVLVTPVTISAESHIKYGQLPPSEIDTKTWSGKIPTKSVREKQAVLWRFIDVDNPASYLCVVVAAEAMDTQDKASNKAFTAAYKNAWIKTFMLITGEPELEDGTTEEVEPKPTRGQQMTQAARGGDKATTTAAKAAAPTPTEPKPSVSTDPRPGAAEAKPDPLEKAKDGLRELVGLTGLSKEEVDEYGQRILGEPRSVWVKSSVKINKLVKGIQMGVAE